MHIAFSYYYFTAACLNNTFAFFALAPEISARHRVPWYQAASVRDTSVQVAFHGMWLSPTLGVLYLLLYQYKQKPHYSLGLME
eukprot:SAG11_NODE_27490_length_332_cov_0.665236_1_plen_82_part_10